ncbi:hypothetical protein IKG68_00010 [Candidatus Saccharibacteria bacterium]|nr:hypothetical protein [Candidatus Saccharibacteria bacterium]
MNDNSGVVSGAAPAQAGSTPNTPNASGAMPNTAGGGAPGAANGTPNPLNPEPNSYVTEQYAAEQTEYVAGPAEYDMNAAQYDETIQQYDTVQQMPAEATQGQPMPAQMQATEAAQAQPMPAQMQRVEQQPEPELKGSVVEPVKKKSKVGIIIAVLLLLVAIGAAVAAILIINPFKTSDRVPAAISKLMSGAPEKVALTGTITATPSDETSPFSSLEVVFGSGIDNKNGENYVNATVTATMADESEFTFDASEVHTVDGDLYLKLTGIKDALDNYKPPILNTPGEVTTETNCVTDKSGATNCETVTTTIPTSTILESLGVFEVIDDEWIRIPASTFSNTTNVINIEPTTMCLIGVAGKLNEYGSDFVAKYNANPFVTYSTENLALKAKKDTLYRLSFDTDKLAAFINSMSGSGFANALNACTGQAATLSDLTADNVASITKMLPAIYVEVDNKDNFTRVYLSMLTDTATATADITISYPTSITITEPESYLDYSTVLNQLLTQFYQTPIVDGENVTVEVEATE